MEPGHVLKNDGHGVFDHFEFQCRSEAHDAVEEVVHDVSKLGVNPPVFHPFDFFWEYRRGSPLAALHESILALCKKDEEGSPPGRR
jgi:hypothetical protein